MNNKNFYIYGAGIVATTVYTALKELYHCVPKAFIVTDTKFNPTDIDGIPVLGLSEIDTSDRICTYVVATVVVHHESIAAGLQQAGIEKERIVFVTNDVENQLSEEFYGSSKDWITFAELNKNINEDPEVRASVDITVFQAKSHVDKSLKNAYTVPDYVQPVQVGAALTDRKIADVRDDSGCNISAKNRNYCELTATYYAWKNCKTAYKGCCHYRRIFDISTQQLTSFLKENPDVDVILPYPTVFYPDIRSQHAYCINHTDWNAMRQALQEVAPDYYAEFDVVFGEHYFYNYNMLIAKEKVFNDYCEFMFSVLERVEQLTVPKGWERADRFAGYLGENLTTLYFRKNRNDLKIVHVGKRWFT